MKFTVAGGVAAVVDLTVTWVLQIGLDVLGDFWARTVGWVLGTVLAYAINRRWTFRAGFSKRRFGATMTTYLLTYGVNIVLYREILPLLESSVSATVALVLAFIVSQAVATAINFLVQRFLIFRRG